jgi:branched-chain amino acid transport system substrate-binding protein
LVSIFLNNLKRPKEGAMNRHKEGKRAMVPGALFVLFLGMIFLLSPLKVNAEKSEPIKIGAVCDITGVLNSYGVQIKRALEYFEKEMNSKGGILGRPIEIIFEDSQSDPAVTLRKMRKLVESDKVKFLTGPAGSNAVRAIYGHLPRWDAIYLSTVNGAGDLTSAKLFNGHLFRIGHSAPQAARTVRLYLEEAPFKTFMGIASDYVYGRSAIESFQSQVKDLGLEYTESAFTPLGTKDFSAWIGKIKAAKPDVLYSALVGEDTINFMRQAKGYGLFDEVQMLFEQINLRPTILPVGDAAVGIIGSSRYSFTFDNPDNKEFVKKFYAHYKEYPDMSDGEMYNCLMFFKNVVEKIGTADDISKFIKGGEGLEYTSIKGKVKVRACDHQGINYGWFVRVVEDSNYPHPIPEVIKQYPGEDITPPCLKADFD